MVGLLLTSAMAWAQPVLPAGAASAGAAPTDEPASAEAATTALAPAVLLHHVPPATGAVGSEVVLRAVTDDLETGQGLVARWRAAPDAPWSSVPFLRAQDGAWVARLPTSQLPAGPVAYYLEASAGPDQGPRFGDPERPWSVDLFEEAGALRAEEELERLRGQRSQARTGGTWRPWAEDDHTWSAWGEFSYRPLGAVRSFRLGIERVRGITPVDGQPIDTGYDRGYSEVEFALTPRWSISPEIDLGAQEEFTAGGGISTRIGLEAGTHARLGFWGLGGVALSASGAFYWDTVPRLPMGIFFEWTDGPARTRWGSRLGYEVGVRLGDHAELRAQAAWQGRTAVEGALGGGGSFAWSF
jgi:hypothetical protein